MILPRDDMILPPTGSIPLTYEDALDRFDGLKDKYAVQGNYTIALLRQAQSIRNQIITYIDGQTQPSNVELENWKAYLEYEPVDGHLMPTFEEWLESQ